ncbi:hypothetical protein [Paenibacillus sp. BJ-4]|uniref:hypothetical protein n=1 Tax=Paenibacillus sp. BJ-4 TaxID=2878097 RepID=UPI001CF073A0|nr:hypothetical protein [Paenibacillus sp. BJ-4]
MPEVFKMPKYPCAFCKKRESTQLCDFVIGYSWTSMKDERGRMIGGQHQTCNNGMCKECATNYAGFEFCPSCVQLYKLIQEKHDRRPNKFLADVVFGKYEPEEEQQ